MIPHERATIEDVPRTLDVETRDRAVVDAAWRVIVRDGLPALSVRTLAAEAGLPPSSLRTTFPSQAGARRAAVVEALLRRQRRLAAAADPAMLLDALLPLDDDRRTEASVLLALRTAALVDAGLRGLQEEADELALTVCEDALRLLGANDPELVQLLHALVDGLVLRLLQDPAAASCVRAALDRFLRGVAA